MRQAVACLCLNNSAGRDVERACGGIAGIGLILETDFAVEVPEVECGPQVCIALNHKFRRDACLLKPADGDFGFDSPGNLFRNKICQEEITSQLWGEKIRGLLHVFVDPLEGQQLSIKYMRCRFNDKELQNISTS